jgi:hypothetical protein
MPTARNRELLLKSVDACLAAMEIYNKPDFRHREEAFAILMLNAWELLLKARILKESGNDLRSIEVWEHRKKPDGTWTKHKFAKTNRSGNPLTISLPRAAELVRQFQPNPLDQVAIANIEMLTEIRDNAVHFINIGAGLSRKVQEIGAASLKNYMHCVEKWFKHDLSRYNFYLMPLAFQYPLEAQSARPPKANTPLRRLVEHFAKVEAAHPPAAGAETSLSLKVELKFVRTTGPDAVPVRLTSDPSAIVVQMSEDDVRKRWPWDYKTLCKELRRRIPGFAMTKQFHKQKGVLQKNPAYCHVRQLDPGNPHTQKQRFYNPSVVDAFEAAWPVKPAAAPVK